MKKFRPVFLILTLALLLSAVSCEVLSEPRTKTYYEYFDTVCTVSSYGRESRAEFAKICDELEEIMKKYNRLMDIYHEYDGLNNLATVNKNAGKAPVRVDAELIDLLLYAKEIYSLTDGEVNVAMGAVLSLWHDCREAAQKAPDNASIPSAEKLTEAAKHISIDCLVIDREAATVYLTDKDASLDVGALGKGYVAELMAQRLTGLGATSYVLDLGGNIRTVGTKRNGEPWVTGITNPDRTASQAFALRIKISDTSCVTSGSYQRFYTVKGKQYHHIIDKNTLYPSEYFSSVTVITPNSALADALSTALFSMSYEEGLRLCQELGAVEAVWIKPDGTLLMTDGIDAISVK